MKRQARGGGPVTIGAFSAKTAEETAENDDNHDDGDYEGYDDYDDGNAIGDDGGAHRGRRRN